MKGQVKIGTKEVEMVANAATPVFYKLIFHEDYFVENELFGASKTNGESVGIYSKIAFVCAHQAKKGCDVGNLTMKDFVKWLEQFEVTEMAGAVDDIFTFYTAQTEKTAVPK